MHDTNQSKGAPRGARQARGLRIGLTGGFGCGKSEVGRILAAEGVAVRDADDIARDVMKVGRPAFENVVARFGREMVGADGEIHRSRLAERVFADAGERKALEAIVHPDVIGVLREWLDEVTGQGRAAVAIVPLLYEVELTDLWDAVICVAATESAVLARAVQAGWAEAAVRDRIRAQKPVDEKAARADYVIQNDGTLDALKRETRKVWKTILREEKRHHG
ncbi:MAG: dephospho-CoA kinase [Verrucomicrobiota bacterium]